MKKEYMKPSMRVVMLQEHTQLLAGSNRGVMRSTSGDWSFDSDGFDDTEYDR